VKEKRERGEVSDASIRREKDEARPNLEDLGGSSDRHSPEVLLLSSNEELSVGGSTGDTSRSVDSLNDETNFSLSSLVLDVAVVQVGDDLRSGLLVSVDEEPSGRSERGRRGSQDAETNEGSRLI